MSTIYTVGNGRHTQLAQRPDGVWFMRRRWRGEWGKWERQHSDPFPMGKYRAPRCGEARLPLD